MPTSRKQSFQKESSRTHLLPAGAHKVVVVRGKPGEHVLEEGDVEEVRVVVDELEAEHLEGEAVLELDLRPWKLCAKRSPC